MRGMRRVGATVLVTVIAAAGGAGAQTLAPGARIRARTPDGPVQATVVRVTDTALVLERKAVRDTFSLSYGRIAELRVALGKEPSKGASVLLGIAGAAVGAVIGHQANSLFKGGAVGASVGVGLGQLIRADRWVAVPVTPGEKLALRADTAETVGGEKAAPARADAPEAVPADTGARPSWYEPEAVRDRALAYESTARAMYLPGMRIRYGTAGAPSVTRIARVLRVAGDTLVVTRDVAGAVPERVRADTLVDFELSRGWENRMHQDAQIGGVIGALILAAPCAYLTVAGWRDPLVPAVGPMLTAAAAMAGGTVGYLIGAGIGRADNRERWVHVATPVASTGHGVRLRLASVLRSTR